MDQTVQIGNITIALPMIVSASRTRATIANHIAAIAEVIMVAGLVGVIRTQLVAKLAGIHAKNVPHGTKLLINQHILRTMVFSGITSNVIRPGKRGVVLTIANLKMIRMYVIQRRCLKVIA